MHSLFVAQRRKPGVRAGGDLVATVLQAQGSSLRMAVAQLGQAVLFIVGVAVADKDDAHIRVSCRLSLQHDSTLSALRQDSFFPLSWSKTYAGWEAAFAR